jgi:3-hydroxyisobutyrate dehydrogenase-like beta-hydroxyacid dehydrogenase
VTATTLAFCGLGAMGAPMAARLLEAGYDVVVWNRTPERAQPLVDQGARQASTPEEAAKEAEGVFTMLATPEAVADVVAGEAGIASAIEPGATLIEMSTIGPHAVRRLAEQLPDGVDALDAPVLGSIPQATDGTLKVFVGGEQATFDRWEPVLKRFGSTRYLGPLGAGAAMKLVANSCLGVLVVGLGEALALADGLSLDQGDVLDVLAESPIAATVKSKRELIESNEWPANFKLSLAAKDMRLVTEEAERSGLSLTLAPAVQERLEAADAAGKGESDYSVVIEDIRGSAGR